MKNYAMEEISSTDKTLWQVMAAFYEKIQEHGMTPYEVALFHVLLTTWNSARRPPVITQWAENTCALTGMSIGTLRITRDRLVEKQVLDFKKDGNRGIPRYSFSTIMGKASPFLLAADDSKGSSKVISKGSSKLSVLTSEEVTKYTSDTDKGVVSGGEFVGKVNKLRPQWQKPAAWGKKERDLMAEGSAEQMAELSEADWKTLGRYMRYKPKPGEDYWQPNLRHKFIETFASVYRDSTRWAFKHEQPETDNNPNNIWR